MHYDIINKWKESLTIFKKDTLLLLLYSWYVTTKRIFTTLFPWMLLYISSFFILYYYVNSSSYIFRWCIGILLFTTDVLSISIARPTIEKKNYGLILKTIKPYIIPAFIVFLLGAAVKTAILSYYIPLYFRFPRSYPILLPLGQRILTQPIRILYTLFVLFCADSNLQSSSAIGCFYGGIKMFVMHFPLFLASILMYFLIDTLFGMFLSFFPIYHPFEFLLDMVLIPVWIGHITVLYIKFSHDHCNTYFGRSNK